MRYYRKVIKIRAEDSPNVQLAVAQRQRGTEPTGEVLIPGVLSFAEWVKRRATWDPIRQCVGLDAEFWEGAELLLFPPHWLNRSAELARDLRGKPRKAKAMGCDPAEGGDKTCWAVVDELGLIDLVSVRTPDTASITSTTLALIREHGVPDAKVCFDRGGGGKEHADRLRWQGHDVTTVAFGESLVPPPRRGTNTYRPLDVRIDEREERYAYLNRRAEMYHSLSRAVDPEAGQGFAIPDQGEACEELRRQLAVFPKLTDAEGRYWLPPKNRKTDNSKTKTLVEMLGHSPDEADALVIAFHAMTTKVSRRLIGSAL